MDVDAVVTLWGDAGLLRPWNDPRHDIAFARQNENSTVLVCTEVWKVQLLVRSGNHPVEAFYEKLGYVDTQSKCFQKILSS